MARVEDDMTADPLFESRPDREYRRAVRHSRRVGAAKKLLPVLALVVVAAFVLYSFIPALLPDNVTIEGASISDGRVVMQNPALTGQTDDAQPYSLTASRAFQNIASPEVIFLEQMRAELPVSDTETATIIAASGIYDRDREFLTLDAPFSVESSRGVRADLLGAEVDVARGEMRSDQAVEVNSPEVSIVAQSLSMRDNGKTIIFERDVRMTISSAALRDRPDATN
jgi:lipopolysaccharide export system protein LptC